MPVSALVVTAGAANASAYVSLAVADQFHLDRPAAGTTWEDATTDEKTAAILWATKLMDSLWVWLGCAVNDVQVLSWPRYGLTTRNGYAVLSTVIPTELQHATAEFARQLLAGDRAGDSDVETQGIKSLKAGPVALTFRDNVVAKVVPDAVVSLIPPEWGKPRDRVASYRNLVRA